MTDEGPESVYVLADGSQFRGTFVEAWRRNHGTVEPFVTYQLADGTDIDVDGGYTFVTGLDWFDDRTEEVRLIKKTYFLVAEEEVVLPHPAPPVHGGILDS